MPIGLSATLSVQTEFSAPPWAFVAVELIKLFEQPEPFPLSPGPLRALDGELDAAHQGSAPGPRELPQEPRMHFDSGFLGRLITDHRVRQDGGGRRGSGDGDSDALAGQALRSEGGHQAGAGDGRHLHEGDGRGGRAYSRATRCATPKRSPLFELDEHLQQHREQFALGDIVASPPTLAPKSAQNVASSKPSGDAKDATGHG